jgi:phenylacetate-CoA ligase
VAWRDYRIPRRNTQRVIFDPQHESLPRERLALLQLDRLRALVERIKQNVPLYRERLASIEPEDLASVEDLRGIPFTRKDDLRETYPLGMLAVPREALARIHASSGATGKPTVVAYTTADLELFGHVNARALAMAGAEPGMTLHNAYGYGLFTGGLGLHGGGETLGLSVVPVSGGMTERQLTLIEDLQADIIACTPSYALTLASAFAERGVSPDELSLCSAGSRRSHRTSGSWCGAWARSTRSRSSSRRPTMRAMRRPRSLRPRRSSRARSGAR